MVAQMDTVGNTPATAAGFLTAVATVTGFIDTNGDADWYTVNLQSGLTFTFAANGINNNLVLTLYDSNGAALASNNDTNDVNPELVYTTTTTGTYYIGVSDVSTSVGFFNLGFGAAPLTSPFTASGEFISLSVQAGVWHALAGDDTVVGTVGTDFIYGENGFDGLYGGAGDDFLYGGANDDILAGDAGDDTLYGGAGGDVLSELAAGANSGNDYFQGGSGVDIMYAAAGDDFLYGGFDAANNFADLGDGNDTYRGSAGTDVVVGGNGIDTISGNNGDDALYGEAGNDAVYGGAGIDLVSGWTGDDFLDGGSENDLLVGDAGNDTLNGGTGIDVSYGGAGLDIIYGGNDADVDAMYGGGGQGIGNNTFQVGGTLTTGSTDYVWDWNQPTDYIQRAAGTVYLNATFSSGNTYLHFDTDANALADYTVVLVGSTAFNAATDMLANTF
jgi:Ca2+-binding RTX toxin-like protein